MRKHDFKKKKKKGGGLAPFFLEILNNSKIA